MEYAKKLMHTDDTFHQGYFFTRLEPSPPSSKLIFQNYWNNLPVDNYIESEYKFRQRRYSRLKVDFISQEIKHLGAIYFQEEEFNNLFGGQHREFCPVDSVFLKHPFFIQLLNFNYVFFTERKLLPETECFVGVHQIRTTTMSKNLGKVTPEGVHKDGHPAFGVHLINRVNVDGGITTLYDNDHNFLSSVMLKIFGDTLLVEDDKLYHGVSPIGSVSEGMGHRDVLIIEFY